MILPDGLRRLRGEADLVVDGAVVPRLAHAEAIHVAHAHVGHHLRRRHHDGLHVVEGMDAVGGEPVVDPHRVRAGGERLRERVLALLAVDERLELGAVGGALVLELVGKRDRLAVVIEVHQHRHVLLRPADAHLHAVDQAIEHVRGIELAVDELVAHAGPRRFLGRNDLDAVFLVELHHRRHHHRRAVGQRDEADLDLLLLGRVGACAHAPARIAGSTRLMMPPATAAPSRRRRCGSAVVAGDAAASPGGVGAACISMKGPRYASSNRRKQRWKTKTALVLIAATPGRTRGKHTTPLSGSATAVGCEPCEATQGGPSPF